MPTNTYTPIGSVTLATATSEVTFTVPTGYRDLVLVVNAGGTNGAIYGQLRLNGDSGNNYNRVQMWTSPANTGTNSSAYSNESFFYAWNVGSSVSSVTLQFLDASATDKQKTILSRVATDEVQTLAAAGRWASTSAISSISLSLGSGNFKIGSTFNLFGIVA